MAPSPERVCLERLYGSGDLIRADAVAAGLPELVVPPTLSDAKYRQRALDELERRQAMPGLLMLAALHWPKDRELREALSRLATEHALPRLASVKVWTAMSPPQQRLVAAIWAYERDGKVTLELLRLEGAAEALADVFESVPDRQLVLDQAKIPRAQLPPADSLPAQHYWSHVCREIDNGLTSGFRDLFVAAQRLRPHNPVFLAVLALLRVEPEEAPNPTPIAEPTAQAPSGKRVGKGPTAPRARQWPLIDVALLTATRIELEAVLARMKPLPGENSIGRRFEKTETYYYGQLGRHAVAVSMCDMGVSAPGATILAADDFLQTWHPKAIIMVGIAFGKDSETQKLRDVLVATKIICYELQRVGRGPVIHRGPIVDCGLTLVNRFKNALSWSHSREDGSRCALRPGPLLSGEKLVDNAEFKAKLFKKFPTAIGGEMEGAGLYAAAQRAGTEWIVVKGICDWGVGKDDQHRPLAAAAATSLVEFVLDQPNVLHGLKARV